MVIIPFCNPQWSDLFQITAVIQNKIIYKSNFDKSVCYLVSNGGKSENILHESFGPWKLFQNLYVLKYFSTDVVFPFGRFVSTKCISRSSESVLGWIAILEWIQIWIVFVLIFDCRLY